MPDWPEEQQDYTAQVVTTLGRHAVGTETITSSTISRGWPTANKAIFVPVWIPSEVTMTMMYSLNGTAVSGNIDAGIYDEGGNRLCSNGGTAQTGTSVTQALDMTDTVLRPGLYYWAMACDNTTATVYGTSGAIGAVGRMCGGVLEQTTAYPLPSTVTFAAATSSYVPLIGATTRTFV